MAETYEQRKQRLIGELRAQAGGPIGLGKDTSNLFRDRENGGKRRIDVRHFNHVLRVEPAQGFIEVEGMTPYDKLVRECLPYGVMPTVVPQLKSITVGGAATGLGIEASSFKYGLVHETILELDILLGDGRVVTATAHNEHRDLFHAFPNSYGTFGYALRLKVKAVPVKPYVELTHVRHDDAAACLRDLARWCETDVDFVDGTVFSAHEMYLTLGRFVDTAPFTSDYTFEHIYYKSIREKRSDYLTVYDYIWRWDTDWFWCSKNLLAQNPLIRRLYGRARLNSITYTKAMRWNAKWGLTRHINRLLGVHAESVIQDVEIPVTNAAAFLDFFQREIGITPVWMCPTRLRDPQARYDLYPMRPDTLYVNFGFWDVVRGRAAHAAGYFNRKIEAKVAELGGMKSLYSDVYYTPEEFWQIYNGPAYAALKQKYDPNGRFKNLYEKCVLKA